MSTGFEHELRTFLVSVLTEVARQVLPKASEQSKLPEMGPVGERLLRPKEAADLLGVSERSLWALAHSGQISCVRIGRLVRYEPAALRDWIANAGSQANRHPDSKPPQPQRVLAKRQRSGGRAEATSRGEKGLTKTSTIAPSPQPSGSRSSRCDAGQPRSVRALFAERLGIPIERLPRLTNGEVMRAAGIDLITCHNWIYRGGELPDAAIARLESFFGAAAKRRVDEP